MFDQIPELDRQEQKRQKKDRREMFVRAALTGLCADPTQYGDIEERAIKIADKTIALLDQE